MINDYVYCTFVTRLPCLAMAGRPKVPTCLPVGRKFRGGKTSAVTSFWRAQRP